jgi:hypothetical protein
MNVLVQQKAPVPRGMVLRWLKQSTGTRSVNGATASLGSRQFYLSTSLTCSSTSTSSTPQVWNPNPNQHQKQQQQQQQQQRGFHSTTNVPHLFPFDDNDNSGDSPLPIVINSDMVDSPRITETPLAGSRAFVDCDRTALIDLFHQYAKDCDVSGKHLDRKGLASILKAVGENPPKSVVDQLFQAADVSGDGLIQLEVSNCICVLLLLLLLLLLFVVVP